jgi:hypothetical protein
MNAAANVAVRADVDDAEIDGPVERRIRRGSRRAVGVIAMI